MSAPRTPRWTPAEIAILREHYPRGGVAPVLQLLPHCTFHAAHVKAHKLGLHTEFRGQAPTPKLVGPDLDEAIRLREQERWSFARIGDRFGLAESTVCNGVMAALCIRNGFTPAQRNASGYLTPQGLERVRLGLKKGLKGIDIQLRLGVSAGCIAEQRRRYNRDLAARGKALLPPPGGGERYSGAKVTRAERIAVEQLYLQGFGVMKVTARTGVSKTSCTRIRERLVQRLKRKGECLPGCDIDGNRHVQAHSFRHIHPEQVTALRALLMDRVPVSRAAKLVALGDCSAFDLRDKFVAELAEQGKVLPQPIRAGRGRKLSTSADAIWPPQGAQQIYAFRALLEELPFEDAKAEWCRVRAAERAAERQAEASRPRTFEDQLRLVATGKVRLTAAIPRAHLEPTYAEGSRV